MTILRARHLAWLLLAILVTVLLAATPPAAPTVSDQEMTHLIALPEDQQLRSPAQDRLQTWFFDNVRAYTHTLDGSSVGLRLVRLGDPLTLQSSFVRPLGVGAIRVEWVDQTHAGDRASPCWWRYDNLIQFSRGTAPTYLRADYTCWHELMHALLENKTISARPADWERYLEPVGRNDTHHPYLEALTMRTVNWLVRLTAVHRFEKRCRQAQDAMDEYQSHVPGPIPYDVERQCYSAAHDAWVQAWPDALNVAPMPAVLRDEFEGYVGVRLPTIENVVTFYMTGGLHTAQGELIKVPRWVMQPELYRAVVIIERIRKSEDWETVAGVHKRKFEVRVLQTYRNQTPARRGTITFRIDGAEAPMGVAVKLGDTPAEKLPGATAIGERVVTVRLQDVVSHLDKGETFHITCYRGDLDTLGTEQVYTLTVEFQDGPDNNNITAYQASKAVFFIHLKPESKSAQPPSGNPAQPTTTPPQTTTPKLMWVLTDTQPQTWKQKRSASTDENISLEKDKAVTSGTRPKPRDPSRTPETITFAHTWTVPGQAYAPGESWDATVGVEQTSPGDTQDMGSSTVLKYGYNLLDVFNFAKNPNILVAVAGRGGKSKDQQTTKFVFPQGANPGMKVYLTIYCDQLGDNILPASAVTYVYTLQSGAAIAAKPSVNVVSTVTQQPQPETKQDRILDNPIPKPGEIIPMNPPRIEDPPPPKVEQPVRWYRHPTGDYRIRLTGSWRIAQQGTADKGVDVLDREDGATISCGRGFGRIAGPESAVLDEAIADIGGARPTVAAAPCSVGGMNGRIAGIALDKADSALWHMVLAHGKRLFYIGIVLPDHSGKPGATPPEDIMTYLDRWCQWLNQ